MANKSHFFSRQFLFWILDFVLVLMGIASEALPSPESLLDRSLLHIFGEIINYLVTCENVMFVYKKKKRMRQKYEKTNYKKIYEKIYILQCNSLKYRISNNFF